jgi:5'-nucleotidase
MTLRGEQIQKLLDTQSRVGRFLQVSSGFSYRVLPAGRRPPSSVTSPMPTVDAGSIRMGGEPLAATKKYRVTVNSFLATGGDQFEVLREGVDRKEGPLDIDALTTYLGKVSSIDNPLEPPTALKRIGGGPCK